MPRQAAETDVLDDEGNLETEQTTATETEGDPPEDEGTDPEEGPAPAEGEPDEVQVTVGEPQAAESDPEAETPVLRQVRQENRQLVRRLRELEKQQGASTQAEETEVLPPRPTMKDEDVDFDQEAYDAKLDKWLAKKAAVESKQRARQDAEQKAQAAYQEKLATYVAEKSALKVKDFTDAESTVRDALSEVQQSILVKYATKSALVVYALGKCPAKLKELAAITDPIEFALAASALEKQVKVTPKTVAPPPERTVRGSASGSAMGGAADKKLNELRAEAAKSGDLSKVMAYKRQMRK